MSDQIVVIGSSNTDFIMKMDRLPRKGETITNASFMQTFGGKGANTAVGAARAGGNVYFVNCVGDDIFGPIIVENLQRVGVKTEYMVHATGIASGSALVMIDGSGDNYLSVAPGANYELTPAQVARLQPLVAQSALMMLQFEIVPETLYAAIDLAVALGKPVLFNYAPARPIDASYFAKVTHLVVNEVEAEALHGFAVSTEQEAHQAATALLQLGVRTVVITLGRRGAVAADHTGSFSAPPHPVKVIDSTAAGDIFCGALAVALVEGHSLRESVTFANGAAAISVTRLGAQPSAPGRQAIDHFLKTGCLP